jgi:hypothetical protein
MISSQKHIILMHFSIFLLVRSVTLKKPERVSVQVFSNRTTEPVWFLKLCRQHAACLHRGMLPKRTAALTRQLLVLPPYVAKNFLKASLIYRICIEIV